MCCWGSKQALVSSTVLIFSIVCVCVCVFARGCSCTNAQMYTECGGRRTTCRKRFSPSPMWTQRIKLRSAGSTESNEPSHWPLGLFLRRSLHQAPPLPSVSSWTLVARTSVRLTIPYHLQCVWQTNAKQEKVHEDLATQGTAINREEMCFISLEVHTVGAW